MTEYTDKVEKQRILMEAEEWGNGVKHIHANNGIIETAYQNGDVHYEEAKKNELDFICSIFDINSLKIAKKVGIDAYKVASSDITDVILLKELSK